MLRLGFLATVAFSAGLATLPLVAPYAALAQELHRISLADYISNIREQLKQSVEKGRTTDDGFKIFMNKLDLKVQIGYEISGAGKVNLWAFDLGADVKSMSTQEVTIQISLGGDVPVAQNSDPTTTTYTAYNANQPWVFTAPSADFWEKYRTSDVGKKAIEDWVGSEEGKEAVTNVLTSYQEPVGKLFTWSPGTSSPIPVPSPFVTVPFKSEPSPFQPQAPTSP